VTQTEQSEFELVLGNKQLLSVFFIVVVLLAVFFFMGYVVGRNSGTAMASTHPVPTAGAPPAETAQRTSPMPQVSPTPAVAEPAVQQPTDTQASQPEPPPTAKAEPSHPAPAETQTPSPQSIGEPPAGTTWLQVVATTRPDAELISETLGKRGFHTQVAPAPNGFFRVLVGPAKGAAEASDLRTRLEGAGFRNPIVRKY
jgi:cell division septation protein DedD